MRQELSGRFWHDSVLSKHKHEGEAASWAGNSLNVIHRHYKGLVKEADATEFWTITPQTVKAAIAKLRAEPAAADQLRKAAAGMAH